MHRNRILILIIGIAILMMGTFLLIFFERENTISIMTTVLIEIGLTILIVNLIISYLEEESRIRTGNLKLYPIVKEKKINREELEEEKGDYKTLTDDTQFKFFYEKHINKQMNLGVTKIRRIKIRPYKDNIEFYFKQWTIDQKQPYKFDYVKIQGNLVNIKNREEFLIEQEENETYFRIRTPLKKNMIYTIEYKEHMYSCMSDLRHLKKDMLNQDYSAHTFLQETKWFRQDFLFPFNIREYIFYARKKRISSRELAPIKIEKDFKKNCVSIEERNILAGDSIWLYYEKK